MDEIWKPITGYEQLYEISNFGRVKSLSRKSLKTRHIGNVFIQRTIRERIKKLNLDQRGYPLTVLTNIRNEKKTFRIHILVWDHFGKSLRDGRRVNIDHIDGNKNNNRINNLRLLYNRENLSLGWARKRETKLPTGVSQGSENSFNARIGYNNEYEYLGSYATATEASLAYQKRLGEIERGKEQI